MSGWYPESSGSIDAASDWDMGSNSVKLFEELLALIKREGCRLSDAEMEAISLGGCLRDCFGRQEDY